MSGMLKITSTEFLRSVGDQAGIPRDGRPHVAFAGRSNVGKSALINYLLNRKGLAGISKSPGKTRMLNFYLVNDSIHFVDLPGYGYARIPGSVRRVWVDLIVDYLSLSRDLRMVVWLLDVRRDPSDEDREMWALLRDLCIPCVVAVTKCDKLKKGRMRENIRRIRKSLELPDAVPMIETSAKERLGRHRILGLIDSHLR
jgi:GTP-binding protein